MKVSDDDLHAYVDGELPPERAAEVAAWLDGHAEEAERVHQWHEQVAGLHRLFDPVLADPIPARLRPAMRHALAPWMVRIAASLLLLAVGAGGGWWMRGGNAPAAGQTAVVAAEALSAHLVYVAEIRHPVEVPASEQAHLVGWLSKRLGTPLAVPDLSPAGFGLVGGRLLPASDGPAAQFMYENPAGQRVTLYLRHNPAGTTTAFRFAEQGGADAFYWLDGPFGYALAASLPRDQLMGLAQAVYHQLENAGAKPKAASVK
ncbi:MAG: anti-sigma factor [Magnetospirillum sp.]|nr:anti-sigma factor [Magnetospirillum sp.]